jgi:hypothetical protein
MKTKLVVLSLCIILAVSVDDQGVMAQTANSTSPFKSRLTLQNGGENAALTVHRNPLGKPCLSIEAASKRHVINPDVFDHVVSVYNTCSKLIKLRICYFKSDHCIDVEVSGQQRKDVVLGIYPNMQYFRYSYQEKF